MANVPRDHHYAPQFFLRNFAIDPEKKKLMTVAKHGQFAEWAKRSIERLGYERDLYLHLRGPVPVSVETTINTGIETPISKSDTWAKIASGRTDALDRSDKAILYALIRHLEVRTPHYLSTMRELAQLSADPNSGMHFSDDEREMYSQIRENPNNATAMFNMMSASLEWTEDTFRGAGLSIIRSPIPLRTSTTPVLALRAPEHPALSLPLSGMVPYHLVLTLNPTTIASLVLADFDDAFINTDMDVATARAFNRHFASQFAYFETVRHLVTDQRDLVTDMTWAPYDVVEETDNKIKFQRRQARELPVVLFENCEVVRIFVAIIVLFIASGGVNFSTSTDRWLP
jgi:hypothetical protein